MATLRKWRREKIRQRSHSPQRSLDIEKDYDWKINRYQKANWADIEAKEAHASVVKYMWRKEYELKKEMDKLKKKISNQLSIKSDEHSESEIKRPLTKREIQAPVRGIHLRTIEDKTIEKLNLIKSERKIDYYNSYIEKCRSKANSDVEHDIPEYLNNIIRGRSAFRIPKSLLAEMGRSAREAKRRELEKLCNKPRTRCIYDIMAERSQLGITHHDNEQHQIHNELRRHRDHDYR